MPAMLADGASGRITAPLHSPSDRVDRPPVRIRRVIIGGMDRLRDRVILITGSTGIAAAAAER